MTGPEEKAHSGLALEVFDPASVGVLVSHGPEHVLVYMNAMYRRILGGDRPLGVPVREVFSDLREREYLDWFDEVFRTGMPRHMTDAPVTVRYPDGFVDERYFSFSISKVDEEQGGPGILVVAVEVTTQVTASDQLRVLAEERRRALHRYQSLVVAGTQKVWVTDPSGRIIERSPAWERVTGMTWEDIRGDGWLDLAHPEDREPLAEAWSGAVREVPDLFEYVYRLRHADGTYRHCELRATPVREDGAVVEWVGACTDVEERWRRDRRRVALARAAAAVTESGRASDAFAALSRVIVPTLADQCGIYLFPEYALWRAGDPITVRRVAALAREGLPPATAPYRSETVPDDSAFVRAVRERRPVHVSFEPGNTPADAALSAVRPWLDRAGAHSGVIVPVFVDGAVVAVITSYVCGRRDPVDRADMTLMRELLELAHAPLSHVMELQRTQRVALALQRSLLSAPPQVEGLRIAARYRPSPSAAEIGGDWYDSFILQDGSTALIIGDVAGHDLDAAVTMSQLRNVLRGLAVDRQEPPGDIMRRMDTAIQLLTPEGGTATCVFGRVENAGDTGAAPDWRFWYTVAGHPPPLLVRADGGTGFLESAQNLLLGGLLPEEERSSARASLPAGSTLLLYTDGLVESPAEDIDRGLERLRRHAASLAREPLDVFCDELTEHPVESGRDDIAVIAVRVL